MTNPFRFSACSALLGTMIVAAWFATAGAGVAHAQGYTPIYSLDYGNPGISGGSTPASSGPRQKFSVATALFPYVNFYRSGYLPSQGTGGTQQTVGQLFALDGELTGSNPHQIPLALGGWYFAEDPTTHSGHYRDRYDLYELHGRAYFSQSRDIGLQFSALRSTKAAFSGTEYEVFAVSEYSSARLRRRNISPSWAVQGGIGMLFDHSFDPNFDPGNGQLGADRTTTDPTFFLSGSVDLGHRCSVILSDWFVRDRSEDINRIALGVGYRL